MPDENDIRKHGVSAFLFTGNDNYSKDKALEELVSSLLDSSSKELDYRVFYGGDANMSEIIDYVNTIPFLAAKKIVVIKNAEKLSKEDKARLAARIKKGTASTCLVLQSAEDSLSELDELARCITVRRFDDLTDHELGSWIKRTLSSRGKSISADAVEVLKELQGQNLLSLNQELEKLAAFVGERGEIGPADVEEVVGKSLTATAFELTRVIEQSKIDDAMRIISDLILSGKKHHEIMGLISWHLRRMMKARIFRDRGESESYIANALRINRRYADEFFSQLNAVDISRIRARMKILLDADLDLKRTKYDPALILEFAVIRLCLA